MMFILNKQLGYDKAENTYQEAWSEYIKVQYALTIKAIADTRPDISEDFAYFLENATKARIKEGVGTEILKAELISDSWYKDVERYLSLDLDKIPRDLYNKLLPLIPLQLNDEQKLVVLQYLEQRIPFIYRSLFKLSFDVHQTKKESEELAKDLKVK